MQTGDTPMENEKTPHGSDSPQESKPIGKKPYVKPAFIREQAFETMALSCGKVTATQRQCQFNRKSS